MTQYASKGVIVTGASRGIGRAVATRLARDGFAVTVNYAGNATKAEEVVTEIKVAGRQAIAVQADVANCSRRAASLQGSSGRFRSDQRGGKLRRHYVVFTYRSRRHGCF